MMPWFFLSYVDLQHPHIVLILYNLQGNILPPRFYKIKRSNTDMSNFNKAVILEFAYRY